MSTIGALSAYQQFEQMTSAQGSQHVKSVQKTEDAKINDTLSAPEYGEIEDKAIISNEAKALYENENAENLLHKANTQDDIEQSSLQKDNLKDEDLKDNVRDERSEEKNILNDAKEELTQSEKQEIAKLQKIDAAVKAHEQAHKAAAGGLSTSAASYDYEMGPDGRKYAVAGEVGISYRKSSDPEQNLENAKKLKDAALAPADPSATDKAVARAASADISSAQKEILQQKQIEEENNSAKDEMTQNETTNGINNNKAENNSTDTTLQKGQVTPQNVPINTAESIINPAAKPIFTGV